MKIQIVPADNGGFCQEKESETLLVYNDSADSYEDEENLHKVLGKIIGSKLDEIIRESSTAIRSFNLDINITTEEW